MVTPGVANFWKGESNRGKRNSTNSTGSSSVLPFAHPYCSMWVLLAYAWSFQWQLVSANRIQFAMAGDLLSATCCGLVASRGARPQRRIRPQTAPWLRSAPLESLPIEFFTRKRGRFCLATPVWRMLEGRTSLFSHRLQISGRRDLRPPSRAVPRESILPPRLRTTRNHTLSLWRWTTGTTFFRPGLRNEDRAWPR